MILLCVGGECRSPLFECGLAGLLLYYCPLLLELEPILAMTLIGGRSG